jgi:predicted pyridoxine 5'-phosphate oxidase superfamily flavin-nucleotide-binding protein
MVHQQGPAPAQPPPQAFIAASPFVVIGSTNELGMVDLSPKGDGAGFVRFLDDKTLAIPDRPGNRRVDTFHNVLQKPGVGLVFFVPGQRETLRVTGRALIVRDQSIRSWIRAASPNSP